MNAFWLLAALGAAMVPGLGALAAESGGEATGGICHDVADLPAIQSVDGNFHRLKVKADALEAAIRNLQAKCAAYKANPSQIGPTLGEFNAASRDTPAKNKEYQAVYGEFTELVAKAKSGMKTLAHDSCYRTLIAAEGNARSRKQVLEGAAGAACDEGSSKTMDARFDQVSRGNKDQVSRAQGMGELGSAAGTTGELSKERVESALLRRNDAQSKADSAALLDKAEAFAKENGLPNPRASAKDTVCGESCVAMLRAQAAQKSYGAESWQYQSLASTARSTQRSRFGSKP